MASAVCFPPHAFHPRPRRAKRACPARPARPARPDQLDPAHRPRRSAVAAFDADAGAEADEVGGGADVLGRYSLPLRRAEHYENMARQIKLWIPLKTTAPASPAPPSPPPAPTPSRRRGRGCPPAPDTTHPRPAPPIPPRANPSPRAATLAPCSKSKAIGSARSALPCFARTILTRADSPALRNTLRTISPPWLISATASGSG